MPKILSVRTADAPAGGAPGILSNFMDPLWPVFVVTLALTLCLGLAAQKRTIPAYVAMLALTWLIFWYLY